MWLLEADALSRVEAALQVSASDGLTFLKAAPVTALSLSDSGRTATIPIKGILTKQADPVIAFFYGENTAYDDIVAQVRMAESNPRVKQVVFDVDSPGGNTDGMFEAMSAIGAMTKPRSVFARNANSAAYALAAVAGEITAAGPSSTFGSVGIAATVAVSDSVVTVTSTHAPDKRPDPRTEEGKAAIVRQLDAIDDLFVGAISEGRGVSKDAVRQGYGRGAVLLAGEAKERGMIDGIAGNGLRVVRDKTQATADGGSEDGKMTLEELKAEDPALFKAVVEIGVKQERDRVCAHLQGGEMSGAAAGGLKIALEAIRAGSDLTQTASMQYLTAAHNKRDIEAREDDDQAVEDALKGVAKPEAIDIMDKLQGETLKLLQGMVGNGGI